MPSKFTWRDLLALNSKEQSFNTPLSCICHIDINAFFSQFEQLRCKFTENDPVVCIQWNSLIAVSYAARKYGIKRMDSLEEAKKKCPKLIPIHTAVFKKGESFWSYKPFGYNIDPSNHKVSLDPYRRESRKILKCFQKYCDQVEKASVDEAFLDLGRIIFKEIMTCKFFGKIQNKFIHGDYKLDEKLPDLFDIVSHNSIEKDSEEYWKFLGDVFNPNKRSIFVDWDDISILIGSKHCFKIQQIIRNEFGYMTSCGVSNCKSISKLASDFKKPNGHTIIKTNCLEDFLDQGKFEITSFWTFGGIKGKELVEILGLPQENSISYIRESWPNSHLELLEYLKTKLLALSEFKTYSIKVESSQECELVCLKLYLLTRGQWKELVNPKPVVKNMSAVKNMRGGTCACLQDCYSWLKVFCSELSSRVNELEKEYNKAIIPKTIHVAFRGCEKYQFVKRSKSSGLLLTSSKTTYEALYKNAIELMQELDKAYKQVMYPLTNLNMSISNMEILSAGSSVIDLFQKNMNTKNTNDIVNTKDCGAPLEQATKKDAIASEGASFYQCDQCDMSFSEKKEYNEHVDYHYAMKLSENLNGADEFSTSLSYGERLLLFGNKSNHNNSISNSNNNNNNNGKVLKKKVETATTNKKVGILKYFDT
ncbi:related to DNA polymerase eta [Saccharomycodes ludwigii]|uniref:Related to DNA polymerase eta n=1 Tax=Saccharomycodes ludwigii TaxID=36035 RepID=A0A376B253_9ASCO|nr:related to DNA polymerase eta [Saccharomycodes ludwigii]